MPSYKLMYFNARGFAEVPRLLFALAKQKYEDKRFTRDEWAEQKSKTPHRQMPVLEIDGIPYCQSSAIARYIARTFGFYGCNDIEALEVDQVLGILQDVINAVMKFYFEQDEERKAVLMKESKEEKLPQYMKMLEKILEYNGGTGFFVGKKISLADVMMYDFGDKIKGFVNYDEYPLIKKSREMVGDNGRIAAWLAKRPVTET